MKQYNLWALLKFDKMIDFAGIADVPGKGVYALIGYYPAAKGNARAELVRVDGVYWVDCPQVTAPSSVQRRTVREALADHVVR